MNLSKLSVILLPLLLLVSCTEKQQTQADERAHDAKREIHKAAHELKEDAQRLAGDAKRETEKLNDRTQSSSIDLKPDAAHAKDKLNDAADKAVEVGREATAKSGELALKARIKTALANDLGMKTLSDVDVSVNGTVATLSGTVATATDKDRAKQTVSSVSGVSQVVDRLKVSAANAL
jgi:osmotically-inducible protein OsmY